MEDKKILSGSDKTAFVSLSCKDLAATLGHLEKLAFGDFSKVPASSLVAIIARLTTSHFQSYLEKLQFFEVPFKKSPRFAIIGP